MELPQKIEDMCETERSNLGAFEGRKRLVQMSVKWNNPGKLRTLCDLLDHAAGAYNPKRPARFLHFLRARHNGSKTRAIDPLNVSEI